jgi:triosephosphate isomerase (TIM)
LTRVFVINLKNYEEILGQGALKLAKVAEEVSSDLDIEIIVAPPVPSIASIASSVKIPVFSQKAEDAPEGKSTGAIIPEALKAWGCSGSIVNHSESRVPYEVIARVMVRLKKNGLRSCLCAETPEEVVSLSNLQPDYLAVEPPELIGTGRSVSKAKPEVITAAVRGAEAAGFGGMVLCGAGIVDGHDVMTAVKLGAKGILVASSIVKAADWGKKISELASALV